MRRCCLFPGLLLVTALLGGCEDEVVRHGEPCIPPPGDGASAVIQRLADAYARRDFNLFASLFPDDSEPPFRFVLSEPLSGGQQYWDRDELLRIHRRMFQPENPLPGEPPVPQELWLVAITITLTPLADWHERPDLYRSPSDSTGLDPARWRAAEAQYHGDILWDTQSDTDYRVAGRASFVVIENLNRSRCDGRKFLLYRWEDLGRFAGFAVNESATWSQVMALYAD